jgi:hypothetical protein
LVVAENSVIGCENPEKLVIQSISPHNCRRLVRCLQMLHGGYVRADFGLAGFLFFRFLTPHIAATHFAA